MPSFRIAQLVADLILGDVGALDRTVVHLIDEQRVGDPWHLLHAVVGNEAADQQQHAETDQHQIDDPEPTVRSVVVLTDRHGPRLDDGTLRGMTGSQRCGRTERPLTSRHVRPLQPRRAIRPVVRATSAMALP